MLMVKTTPNMYGVSLQGDYQDLNALYDSLGRYLAFYNENVPEYPYHEYEYLLALNYDIRHAYMGTRESLKVDYNWGSGKGKNLYYSVDILYPLIFHYLVSLSHIADDLYMPDWFDNDSMEIPPGYNCIEAEHDLAQIRLLISLLWDNVSELFGQETAELFYNYFICQEFGFIPAIYIDALLHYQLVMYPRLDSAARKQLLALCLLEIMDTGDLNANDTEEEIVKANDYYHKTLTCYNDMLSEMKKRADTDRIRTFPTAESFYLLLDKRFPANAPLYHEDFKNMLTKEFGDADWDGLIM